MKNSVKIALTLLISITLSGGFTLLAFSNLFSLIETGIYLPNIQNQAESESLLFAEKLREYNRLSIARYSEIAGKSYIWRAYRTNQSIDDIELRSNELSRLLQEYPKIEVIRLVGPDGRKINFSTSDSDIDKDKSNYQKQVYFNLDKIDPGMNGNLLMTRPERSLKLSGIRNLKG